MEIILYIFHLVKILSILIISSIFFYNMQWRKRQKEKNSNLKIYPFLGIFFVGAYILVNSFTMDNHTCWFKGMEKDKQGITYNSKGDGFQAGILAYEVFT